MAGDGAGRRGHDDLRCWRLRGLLAAAAAAAAGAGGRLGPGLGALQHLLQQRAEVDRGRRSRLSSVLLLFNASVLLLLGRFDVYTLDDPASLPAELPTDLLGVERARDGHEIPLFIKGDSIDVHLVCATQSITINNDHQHRSNC